MMTVLLESAGARGPRRTPWAAASLTAHAALMASAIVLTTQASGRAVETEGPVEPPIFVPMPEPVAERSASSQPSLPRIPAAAPNVPISMPSIPTFDPSVPFSPAPLSEQEIFGRTPPIGAPPSSGGPVGDGIHTPAMVERVASPLAGNGQPSYPRALQRLGLEGEVVVRFVVDSAGRVEPGSIMIVQTTHPSFGDAVREWLPRTRYAPAEIGSRRVRQLVQQTVGFALRR